ncbi:MAG: hypothetical protein EBZ77_16895, partial [Chitinophagia bacterium]|nr:hypothetical protein [Chitinophagia bacterium]
MSQIFDTNDDNEDDFYTTSLLNDAIWEDESTFEVPESIWRIGGAQQDAASSSSAPHAAGPSLPNTPQAARQASGPMSNEFDLNEGEIEALLHIEPSSPKAGRRSTSRSRSPETG